MVFLCRIWIDISALAISKILLFGCLASTPIKLTIPDKN